jgi:hypothetical protein
LTWVIAQENFVEKGLQFPVSAIWYHLYNVQAETSFQKSILQFCLMEWNEFWEY